jgi:S-adenosylmethionine hydrolase
MRPIVALLSDFGTRDYYVGAMKGAVLAACPDATLVDIAHDVPAHDVLAAALTLVAAGGAFPAGTVFLAVVDPGVGSERRGLALAAGRHLFVGPDNGIFTLVLAEAPDAQARVVANPALFRPDVSPVFHGRDVFAPVAGRLAGGTSLEQVGPPVTDPVLLRLEEVRRRGPWEWEATVIHVDRFGNLVTNLTRRDLDAIAALTPGGLSEIVVVVTGTALPLARTYSDVAAGEACALLGSAGRLEIAVHRGSAERELGASRGAPVIVRMGRGE